MFVHEEHIRDDAIKKRLKRTYADVENAIDGDPGVVELSSDGSDNSAPDQGLEEVNAASGAAGDLSIPTTVRPGIHGIVQCLVQAVDDDEWSRAESPVSRSHSDAIQSMRYSAVPIKDLLDYSTTQTWLHSFYTAAVRSLDDDLELYQLLDLDAEGIDDPDLYGEDVLAE